MIIIGLKQNKEDWTEEDWMVFRLIKAEYFAYH